MKNLSLAAMVMLVLSTTATSAQQMWMGFRNPDGSQDTYGPNGQVYMGFANPDGSQDTYGPKGQVYMGFGNPDGSQDTYGPIGGDSDDE